MYNTLTPPKNESGIIIKCYMKNAGRIYGHTFINFEKEKKKELYRQINKILNG